MSLAEPSSNLKGIMLSERPANTQSNDNAAGPIPFRPANVTRDPVGLGRPPRLLNPHKKPKPREALVRHRSYLKELQDSMRSSESMSESTRAAETDEGQKLREMSVAFHRAVLSGGDNKEEVSTAWMELTRLAGLNAPPLSSLAAAERSVREQPQPTAADDTTQQNKENAATAVNASTLVPGAPPVPGCKTVRYEETQIPDDTLQNVDTELEAFVKLALSKAPAPEAPKPAPAAPKPPKPAAVDSKPAWALSASEVEAKEAEEEEALLAFAEGLDYDKFLAEESDAELQEALSILRQGEGQEGVAAADRVDDAKWRKAFVRALNHVAMRDVQRQKAAHVSFAPRSEAQRTVGGETTISQGTMTSEARARVASEKRVAIEAAQAAKASEPQWDASTRADSTAGKLDPAAKMKDHVDEFLRMNPELKAVHSATSARILLSRDGVPPS